MQLQQDGLVLARTRQIFANSIAGVCIILSHCVVSCLLVLPFPKGSPMLNPMTHMIRFSSPFRWKCL